MFQKTLSGGHVRYLEEREMSRSSGKKPQLSSQNLGKTEYWHAVEKPQGTSPSLDYVQAHIRQYPLPQ